MVTFMGSSFPEKILFLFLVSGCSVLLSTQSKNPGQFKEPIFDEP